MSLIALLPVVVAACTHASWNILARRAAHCRHFSWYDSVGAAIVYLPRALIAWRRFEPSVSVAMVVALVATGVPHASYSATLRRLSRRRSVDRVSGRTGPLLAFVGAIFVLCERPTPLAPAGALRVCAGVFTIAGGRRRWRDLRRALVRTEYRQCWKPALGVVAPARELSMLIGAWFGARVLGEGDARQRFAAAGLIVAGGAALALG